MNERDLGRARTARLLNPRREPLRSNLCEVQGAHCGDPACVRYHGVPMRQGDYADEGLVRITGAVEVLGPVETETDVFESAKRRDRRLQELWQRLVTDAQDAHHDKNDDLARVLFGVAAKLDVILDNPERPHLGDARRAVEKLCSIR